MANKVGALIREARTKAGLTQDALAKQLEGISASDISKAERGEKELSQSVLKQIAKITGVTQSSLINAAKENDGAKTSAKKEDSSAKKETTAKKTSNKDDLQLTASEKKLVELYRAADSETKKAAVKLLKGEQDPGLADVLAALLGGASGSGKDQGNLLDSLLSGVSGNGKDQNDLLGTLLGGAAGLLGKK